MRYSKREWVQRILRFEPQARVGLPHDVRQEAVALLATLIAMARGDAGRLESTGGGDE